MHDYCWAQHIGTHASAVLMVSPPPLTVNTLTRPRLIKYLYDGDCSICRSLKALLERQDGGQGRILFVNIASSRYDPEQHGGISYEDAMESIHAIRANGEVCSTDFFFLCVYFNRQAMQC